MTKKIIAAILCFSFILSLFGAFNNAYAYTPSTINSNGDFSRSDGFKITEVQEVEEGSSNPSETKFPLNPTIVNTDDGSNRNVGVGELIEYEDSIITAETVKHFLMIVFSICIAVFITIKLTKIWRNKNA